ncbi:hypothetical protein P4O66_008029, partial [Electrophorus voltai]
SGEESYRPLTNHESRYQGDQSQGLETTGSYYTYWDHQEYYREHNRKGESDDGGGGGSPFDSPSKMDTVSADSESEEPPVPKVPPKAPPRRLHSGTSRQPKGASGGVLSSDEDTPSTKDRSPRAQAPKPKPHKGKKAASPVPTLETGQSAKASLEACALKPEQPPPHTSGSHPAGADSDPAHD